MLRDSLATSLTSDARLLCESREDKRDLCCNSDCLVEFRMLVSVLLRDVLLLDLDSSGPKLSGVSK